MKKSISLLVAICVVFSMFASVAFGAEAAQPSTQDKYDALAAKGIFTGYPDGSAGLERNMTRAQFAVVLKRVNSLENDAAASKYVDVPAKHWAIGEIGAVTKAELMNGVGANKFAPNGNVTIEALATTLIRALGLEPVEGAEVPGASAWAAGYVKAALDANLIPAATNYKAAATRGQLVDATFAFVGGKEEEGALKVTKASQTGAKKITLEFNKAVTKDLAIEVKYLTTTLTVTKEFAADLKSVVLTAAYYPAGDITIKAGDAEVVTVKAENEKAAKVSITAETLRKANGQSLGVKKLNQFGEETTVGSTVYTNVFNTTQGKPVTVSAGKVDLKDDAVAKVDDTITVTALTYDGLSDNKSFKVTAASSATKIELGVPSPLKDKTRITAGEEGLVLPLNLVDQFGKTVTLSAYSNFATAGKALKGSFEHDALNFYVGGDTGEIANLKIDDKGVITFKALTAGNVTITVFNTATSVQSFITFKIEGAAALKELKLSNPASAVIQGEDVVIPYNAVDSFGGAIAAKDLVLDKNVVSIQSSVTGFTYKLNGKGELVFNFTGKGTAVTNVFVNHILTSNLTFEVQPAATTQSIQGLKDVATTLEVGATQKIEVGNVQYVDSYGRVKSAEGSFSITKLEGPFSWNGTTLEATGDGSGKFTVVYDGKELEIGLTAVKHDAIKSYEIKSVGTIYGYEKNTNTAGYQKAVELNGKLENGTVVALKDVTPTFVTSSEQAIVKTVGTTVYGLKAGKSTVAAYLDGAKVAEAEVTASDAAPVATTVKFSKDEYTVALNGTVKLVVEVKDQYGVLINPGNLPTTKEVDLVTVGTATVNADSKFEIVVSAKAKQGVATITFVTSNGATATTTVVVG